MLASEPKTLIIFWARGPISFKKNNGLFGIRSWYHTHAHTTQTQVSNQDK